MLRAGLRTHLFFKRCPGTSWKLKVPALSCLSKSVFVELNCRCGGHQCLLALSSFCMSWLDCCSLAQTPGEYSREAGQFLMGTKATSLVLKPLDDIFHVWSFHFILFLIAKERQYNPSSCFSNVLLLLLFQVSSVKEQERTKQILFVDMLKKMLHLNPARRIKPSHLLRHQFLTGFYPQCTQNVRTGYSLWSETPHLYIWITGSLVKLKIKHLSSVRFQP